MGSGLPARVGPYAIEGELGRGGMGVVYRGRDPAGAPVAIKLLLGSGAASARTRSRFEREIAVLKRLDHPNLVGLRDAGRHGDHRYLVMELLPGRSLQARLEERGPLPQEEAVRIGVAIAEALTYVHREGVIHRDLKPENVLLDAEGAPRLTDFGLVTELAGDTTRLTRTGAFLGSPSYWAPEQAAGEPATPATDVYGLGALLYALLTGRPPHEGETLVEAMAAAARGPGSASRLRPDLDRRLEAIVRRCMAREPAARFPSAAAAGASLEDWLLTGPEPPDVGRRWIPILAALAALLALTLGVVLATRRGRAPAPAEASATSSPLPAAPASAPPARPAPQPSGVAPLLARAERLILAKQYAEAQEVLSDVLARDRFARRALLRRGWVRRKLGDPARAILDFDRLLSVRPDDVEGLVERAAARAESGDVRGAIDDCTKAIFHDPRSYRAFHERALWRMRLRPPAAVEALEDLERAVALRPTGEALADRGLVRHRLKKPGVVEDLKAALTKLDRRSERYRFVKLALEGVLQERRRGRR